jgi:hypothetical protein
MELLYMYIYTARLANAPVPYWHNEFSLQVTAHANNGLAKEGIKTTFLLPRICRPGRLCGRRPHWVVSPAAPIAVSSSSETVVVIVVAARCL